MSDFTLEKLKINERLGDLEVTIAKLESVIISELGGHGTQGNVNKNINEMFHELKTIAKLLRGNGEPGIITRIDRLEIIEKDRKWTNKLVLTTLMGLVANFIYEVFFKK